jgi:integrase
MSGRQASGSLRTRTRADGTLQFELRFSANGRRESVSLHERADCECGCGGGWTERAARRELSNVLARVRAGVWRRDPPSEKPAPSQASTMPTFHEYASLWLQRRPDGVLGDRPLSEYARNYYLWLLRGHLLPFFGPHRLDAIDAGLCLDIKAKKMCESRDLRADLAAGADVRDDYNRRRVPLGPSSIRKAINCLAAILDDAIEDGHIDRNPARGKRMRVRVSKPLRTFLELDELRALIDAAATQDPRSRLVKPPAGSGETARRVAALLTLGMSQDAIAAKLGRTKAMINWHARRMSVTGAPYLGREFIVRVLGYSGVRNSEAVRPAHRAGPSPRSRRRPLPHP